MWKKCLNNIENVGQADRTCKQTKYKKNHPNSWWKSTSKNVFFTYSGRFKMMKEDLNNISCHSCKKYFLTNTVF